MLNLTLNGNRSITTNTAHRLTISGTIGESGGARQLTKAGGAELTLSAPNTFSGQLLINNGQVNVSTIGNANAAGGVGTNPVIRIGNSGNSGVLNYTGSGETTTKQIQVGAGTVNFTGGAEVDANGSAALVFSAGTFNSPFSTATAARLLTLGGTSTAANEIQGIIADNNTAGGGVVDLTKLDNGLWILSGANTFTGAVTVQGGGTLQIAGLSALGAGSGPIRLGNANTAGTLDVRGAGGTVARQFVLGSGTGVNNNGAGTIASNGTGPLVFSSATFNTLGTFSAGNTGTRVLTLSGTNTGDNVISGAIVNNGVVGSGTGRVGLTKTGAGTWILRGDNAYEGTTTVSAGTLVLDRNGGALPDAGTVAIGDGSLQLNFAETIGSLTLTGSGSILGTAPLTVSSGSLTASSAAARVTVAAPLAGASGLVKAGSGAVVLTGTNTYSGTTSVSAGTLQFGARAALYGGTTGNWTAANVVTGSGATLGLSVGGATGFTAADVVTIAALGTGSGGFAPGGILGLDASGAGAPFVVTSGIADPNGGANPLAVSIFGGGTVVLSASNSFSGGTTLAAGGLNLDNARALGAGPLTIAGGTLGTTAAGGVAITTATPIAINAPFTFAGAENLSLGTGTATITGAHTLTIAGNGTLSIANLAISLGSGFTWNVTTGSGAAGSLQLGNVALNVTTDTQARTRTFTINGGTTTISGDVSNGNAFNNPLTKQGDGTLVLSGSNSYGTTTVSAGTLRLASATALPSGRALTVGAGTLDVAAATSAGAVTLNSTGTISGTGTLGGTSFALTNATGASVVTASLGGSGLVTKSGAGATTLSGSNVHTGGTTLSAGVLNIGHASALGTGTFTLTSGTFDNAAGSAIVLATNNATTLGGDVTFAGTNDLNLGTGAFTLTGNRTLTVAVGRLTIGGPIRPDATVGRSFTKAGAGTLLLLGTTAYTGPTAVSAGSLVVNGTVTSGTVTVASGATLAGSGRIGGQVSGDGLVAPGNSPGILTATSLLPTATTSFAFEVTQLGSPTWGSGTASGNDVLRLTDPTAPFAAALAGTNVVDVYFGVSTLAVDDVFRGGFYTDAAADFFTAVDGATYAYYVLGNGAGTDKTYGGQGWYALGTWATANLPSFTGVTRSTVVVPTAAFASGSVTNGRVTEFVIVPEPRGTVLALLGAAVAGLAAWQGGRVRRATSVGEGRCERHVPE